MLFSQLLDGLGQCLFLRTCKLLHQLGIMDMKEEYADAIGLIVGGTDTQPVHCDVAVTAENEAKYEDAMGNKKPPASLLVGFGHAVRIGVLKEDITLSSDDGWQQQCTVVGADSNDTFCVVSEEHVTHERSNGAYQTTHVAVLESDYGFCFKGDFFHAGAPMVLTPGEQEYETWSKVQRILQPLLQPTVVDKSKQKETDFTTLFPKLCAVPSLNTITRLHVQLCPILADGDTFQVEHDSVGVFIDGSKNAVLGKRSKETDGDDDDT